MNVYIFLYKNFSVCAEVPDFEVLTALPEKIFHGKVVTILPGEYVDVMRVSISEDEKDIQYQQFKVSNIDGKPEEVLTGQFILQRALPFSNLIKKSKYAEDW